MPDPVTPARIPTYRCEGYVWKYRIIIPRAIKDTIYFKFSISSKSDVAEDLHEFLLYRNVLSEKFDQDAQQKQFAVSYSSIITGVVATVKDALISGKKIAVEYMKFMIPGIPRRTEETVLAVELLKE